MAELNAAQRTLLAQMQNELKQKFIEDLNQQRAEGQICTPAAHQRPGQVFMSSGEHNKGDSNMKMLSFGSTPLSTQARVAAYREHTSSKDSKGRFTYHMFHRAISYAVKVRTACSCLELDSERYGCGCCLVHAHVP